MEFGTDHTQTTCNFSSSSANLGLTRDIIEMDPCAVCSLKNSFGTKDNSKTLLILKNVKCFLQFLIRISAGRLETD